MEVELTTQRGHIVTVQLPVQASGDVSLPLETLESTLAAAVGMPTDSKVDGVIPSATGQFLSLQEFALAPQSGTPVCLGSALSGSAGSGTGPQGGEAAAPKDSSRRAALELASSALRKLQDVPFLPLCGQLLYVHLSQRHRPLPHSCPPCNHSNAIPLPAQKCQTTHCACCH